MTGSRYRQGFPAAIRRGLDYTNKLNDAQLQLAERSYELRDLVSVGTLMSLTGLALVIHGAQRIDTLSGVNEVAAGRGFDLADGFLARAFDQESDLGAAADAVSDKVGMGCIIVNAWRRGAVPKWALSTVLASNVINAGLTGIAVARHPHASYRPPAEGKHAMTLYNAGVLGFAYANALENEQPDRHFHEPQGSWRRVLSRPVRQSLCRLPRPTPGEPLRRLRLVSFCGIITSVNITCGLKRPLRLRRRIQRRKHARVRTDRSAAPGS